MNLRFVKILLFVLCPLLLSAQKEANNWFFGEHAGLNFNSGVPVPDTNGAMILSHSSTIHCATISDKNGNLLFYTDGNTVWNKLHQIMLNGTGILSGGQSSDVLIIPFPGKQSIYYIFTCNYFVLPVYNFGLRYSIVDMSKNGGLGELISKNNFLFLNLIGALTAVKHSDGRSVWIIAHHNDSNLFYTFLLKTNGLDTIPVISTAGSNYLGRLHNYGVIKNSPDGRFLTFGTATEGITELFHFNNNSGAVTYLTNLKYQTYSFSCIGIEYSPDGSRLYLSGETYPQPNVYIPLLLQYDLSLPTIIRIRNSYQVLSNHFGYLQLGLDGKIYMEQNFSQYSLYYLASINNPNKRGSACNYTQNALYLGGRKCTSALPTFMQSYFYFPDFKVANMCFGDSSIFSLNSTQNIDSVLWVFGDNLGSNNYSKQFTAKHRYSDTGLFYTRLIMYSGASWDTSYRYIQIGYKPHAFMNTIDSIQCYKGNNFIFNNYSTLQSGLMSYEWNFGDSTIDYSINPKHSFSKDGSFNVNLIAISNYGCTDTFTKNIIVRPSPIAGFTVNDSSQCLNVNSFKFTNQSNGYKNSYWNFGDGLNDTKSSPVHTYSKNDTFIVKLVVVNNFGCKDSIDKELIVFPKPKAEFTVNDSIQCLSNNSYLFSNTSSGIPYKINNLFWNFGDGSTDTASKPKHSYIKADTFKVRMSVTTEMGCSDTITKQIIVEPMPIADFLVNDSIQCLQNNHFIFTNKTLNLKFSKSHFTWNFGDNSTDTAINPVHSYSKADTFTIQLLSMSEIGCKDSILKKISFYDTPKSKFVIYDSSQCLERNNFGFINTSVISSGSMYYLWNFGDGINSTLTNPSHSYLVADTFNVLLVATSDKNCIDSFSSQTYIHVHPKPLALFSINDSTQCLSGNNFVLTNNSTVMSGTFSDKWDFADGFDTVSYNASHSYSIADSYMVKLLIVSDWACKDSILKQVVVYPEQTNSFNVSDSTVCIGEVINFNNTCTYNFGTLAFNWNFGDGNITGIQNPQHSYVTDSIYNVKLISINNFGCKDSIFKQVIVNPQPGSNFSINDSSQCLSGNSFIFTNNTSGANTNIWSFGDGQNDTNRNTSHNYSTYGNYTAKLKSTSKEGCTDSISKTIVIFPQPKTGYSINDSTQCLNGNNFQLSNSTTGVNKYIWDFGDSKSDTNLNSSHAYNAIGIFKIKLFATSLDKCTDSFIKQVSILPQPVSGYGVNDTNQCLHANLYQFANSTTGVNSYKWDFGDGNSDTVKNPDHSYLSSGNYNTKLISQSSGGCKDTSSLTLIVREVPTATFGVNDTSQILPSNSFIFSNLTNCKPASSTCKYLWDFGDSKSDTSSNPTHTYTSVGKYLVMLTSTSTNGCKDTVSLLVNVFNIIVNTVFTVKDICLGDYAFFINSSTIQFDSFLNFLWDFGDGNTIVRPNPQHLYADTGTYKVQLISLSYGGYRDTTNGKVRVLPAPTVEIIATPDSILEQGIKATLSVNGTFDSLLWSTGAITASIEVDKVGIYSIRVVDVNGCDAVDKINIEYLPEKPFKTMNVITPNGDGINDYWKVFNIETYQPCKLAIYNRWGDELFSSSDYQNNWDGTYKGKHLPEGTYYFVLETKDGKVYKGAVNILK